MRFLRHASAIVAAPVTVTIAVPAAVLVALGSGSPPMSAGVSATLAVLGVLALAIGLALLAWTIFLFDREGNGTLAPWDPPTTFVLRGPYRHVRNPMISGVLFVLLGEAMLWASPVLLVWFVLFFAVNQTYILLWEEPVLARRFGEDYVRYQRHVRRWLPRVRPWEA